jgi:hypothetical protein
VVCRGGHISHFRDLELVDRKSAGRPYTQFEQMMVAGKVKSVERRAKRLLERKTLTA